MELNTTTGKTRDGITFALTSIPLGAEFGARVLRIETRKHSIYGGIYCSASVVEITPGGFRHAIGLGAGGDFSKTLTQDRKARATEKAIRTMHAQCLPTAAAVLAEARAHYPQPATA